MGGSEIPRAEIFFLAFSRNTTYSGSMNKDYIKKANKSARSKGAIGKTSVVVKKLIDLKIPKDFKILDYGSGPDMVFTKELREKGYDVDAFDFGENFRDGMVEKVQKNYYDFIFASNVLNVWSDILMFSKRLNEIKNGLKKGGEFLANYPAKPRYFLDFDENKVKIIISIFFPENEIIIYPKNIFHAKK